MQTLRKKTSPLKYKNETTRFLGDGVSFKAKLIGILEVSEARGDRMCQEALSDLKMAIRAAGEHKQRITINIAIDGLRLRDEKTGDSLYHHPVHKISFIAQDMADSRAFGYIFGSPDTGHRFFGIKTDKAASQVVIAMRDLFQVVFALKKKEIELAKQHLDKNRYANPPLFSDLSAAKLKAMSHEAAKSASESKAGGSGDAKSTGTAVADLVDLELELNSLQQGLNQMERITPSDPFGAKDDPFGDSFISYTKPILPPPPSTGRERSSRSSETSSIFSPRTPHNLGDAGASADNSIISVKSRFSHDFTSSSHDEPSSGDWFTPNNSIFEEPPLVPEPTKDEKHEITKQEILSQFDVFTELDPLELKNPPKKVLNDLVVQNPPADATVALYPPRNLLHSLPAPSKPPNSDFATDPFGEDPFVTEDPFAETDFGRTEPLFEPEIDFKPPPPPLNQFHVNFDELAKKDTIKLMHLHENPSLDMSSESECAPEPPPRPHINQIKPPPLPPKKQANDLAVKPPPRPPHSDSHYDYMDNYETAPSSLEFIKAGDDKTPPIPVPQRKNKFESDFVPERPRKHLNSTDSNEEYLTPITFPLKTTSGLLPPPAKAVKKPQTAPLDGLDITLSQLTLSGLNELAGKLQIPTNQLSNMTLAQLTAFLSNFIKNGAPEAEPKNEFKADFAANFSSFPANQENYDRYAVFRELIKEEIKQTKIDTEPEEIQQEQQEVEEEEKAAVCEQSVKMDNVGEDRYAALREIVENELKGDGKADLNKNVSESDDLGQKNGVIYEDNKTKEIGNDENETKFDLIEYNTSLDSSNNKVICSPSPKSPVLKPIQPAKSPIPIAVTEIVQNNARLTSGSLSDVVSGSSPEVDNTGSNSEKKNTDAAGESWAIFDQGNIPSSPLKDKPGQQSEEGVSPWSSDSKEFNNTSPPPPMPIPSATNWRPEHAKPEHYAKHQRRSSREWWGGDSAAVVASAPYYNRRSTDSYDEEYYPPQQRQPRRRIKQPSAGGYAQGGHSSSSRDVSPWEEEPRAHRGWRHPRHSFEKRRPHTADSWDDEDEYGYDEDEPRFHPARHAPPGGDEFEEWRHRRRGERWCCPDWDQSEHEKLPRYGGSRWGGEVPPGMWRSKHDERYYSRESQESPWEDEYLNETEETAPPAHYVNKRNWKRPSSASEMDRKTGEIKSRHYLATGGSDGERDRRFKAGRRSRSRDSQYSEPMSHRHAKPEPNSRAASLRNRPEKADKKGTEAKSEHSNKKSANTLAIQRKKGLKEVGKEDGLVLGTFPRKSRNKFENDFVENDSEPESEPVLLGKAMKALSLRPKKKPAKAPKSLFEDDFSPGEKGAENVDDNSISSIKEENDGGAEEEDSFGPGNMEANATRKKKLKHRLSSNGGDCKRNLKKSDSVNIFARENDPFDDDFFSENAGGPGGRLPRISDLKWTDDFDDFNIDERK